MVPPKDKKVEDSAIALAQSALDQTFENYKVLSEQLNSILTAQEAQTRAVVEVVDIVKDLAEQNQTIMNRLNQVATMDEARSVAGDIIKQLDIDEVPNDIKNIIDILAGEKGIRNRLNQVQDKILHAFSNWKVAVFAAIATGFTIGSILEKMGAADWFLKLIKAVAGG